MGLFWWNIFLSALSWGCAYNIVFKLILLKSTPMWADSVCYQKNQMDPYSVGFENHTAFAQVVRWFMIFMASKVPEMMDTVWLVLNKKEIITLQWWHHLTVMLYCWAQGISYPDSGDGVMFACINSCIHSIMYPYYALALKYKFARSPPIRMTITSLQISQMFFGVGLRLYSDLHCSPIHPERQRWVGIAGWTVYSSYLVLFIKFFLDEYVFHTRAKGAAHKKTTNGIAGRKMATNGAAHKTGNGLVDKKSL